MKLTNKKAALYQSKTKMKEGPTTRERGSYLGYVRNLLRWTNLFVNSLLTEAI